MPAWVRKSIVKQSRSVASGAPISITTDPSLSNEIAAADEQVDWINLESIGTNVTLKFYRHEGARADLLKQLDASGTPALTIGPSAAPGITPLAWPAGAAGAARKVSIEATCSSGTESFIIEMDSVYRSTGG